MRHRLPCLAVVYCLCGGVVFGAQGGEYPELRPVDDAVRQSDFFSFRAGLQAAVARRDVDAVLAMVDPGIRNSFGDDSGGDAFRRQWMLEREDSLFWGLMGATLALGGTFQGDDTFMAPYTFSRWPDGFDPFEHVAIIGARVRVRDSPGPDSRAIFSRAGDAWRLTAFVAGD